ncbi:hypothetical protein V6N13_024905 [Hibiscus sabdariffa]
MFQDSVELVLTDCFGSLRLGKITRSLRNFYRKRELLARLCGIGKALRRHHSSFLSQLDLKLQVELDERRRTNFVEALRDSDGHWCSDQTRLQTMASDFYRNLFTGTMSSRIVYDTRGRFMSCTPSMEQSFSSSGVG